MSGALIPGFPGADPLSLADATIYVPTQRGARALEREIARAHGGQSVILPHIAPLGVLEPAAESENFEWPSADRIELKPAVGDLARRMALTGLVSGWGLALKGAIRRVDLDGRLDFDEGEPSLVAGTPAQALSLAGDLASLIDDMIIEGVPWEKLKTIVADACDPYWKITLDFLGIATSAWPKWLEERGLYDRAERTALAIEREMASLRSGASSHPTIIAGSTGTNRAVARLIGAIARAPRGAVVLAGLDQRLDDSAWASIGEDAEGASAGHPQAALRRLLARIEIAREDVTALSAPPPGLQARAALLSEALRPAESTDVWPSSRLSLGDGIGLGLAGASLVVADHEAEESLTIAIALREALETPGRRAALITPDPAIARRVAADLARWGVEVENSAGRTLGDTAAGVLARASLSASREFAPLSVSALLGQSHVRLGRSREAFVSAARAIDLSVLRVVLPPAGLRDLDGAFTMARAAAAGEHAHRAIKSLREADWRHAEALLADLAATLAPLRDLGRAPLTAFIAAHRDALDALVAPADLASLAGGEALSELLDEWTQASEEDFICGLGDYLAMVETLLAGYRAPPSLTGHPRIVLLGLLEARLLDFDLVVVAGLDETIWPPAARTDAFLNRTMRVDLGLSAPERRIGQTAQDFVAALGAAEVMIVRSRKRGGSPTVESRFLQRIGALVGEVAIGEARQRGDHYLTLARTLDRPVFTKPAERPEPRPPLALRPERLSVTRIETLRRDPYAIYAERILRLAPLGPIGAEIGPREMGDVWHAALEAFALAAPASESSQAANARLVAIAERIFAPLNADAAFRALRWPRICEAMGRFLDFDAGRRAASSKIWVEAEGKLEIALKDGASFMLTARADRIEEERGGHALVIDYKTGAPPGQSEVEVGFAPQLTLEAAMLIRGGFAKIGPLQAEGAVYLKLGGADGGRARPLKFKTLSFREVVERHYAGLKLLLDQFRDESTPYLSRPFPKYLARGDDYDHLARAQEWAAVSLGDKP